MDQHLHARFEIADDRMGIKIAQQEHHLEKEQAGGPDRGGSAEPGQDNFGNHRLHLEQQEGAHQNR